MVLPSATAAFALYFGWYGYYGERGYLVLQERRAELAATNAELAALSERHQRLQHRIDLLQAEDPDLVEELARTTLMDGAPGQVAVPRKRQ